MKISFYKLQVLLRKRGKTFYSLRKDKVVGTETIKKLQQGHGYIDTRTILNLCNYLDCQPGDIMDFIPDRVEKRILELTEEEEEKLREYYDEKWSDDDEYEEKVCLRYEEDISNAIIRLEEDAEDEDDTELCKIFSKINFKYSMRHIQNSWDEIEEEYEDFSDQIHEFFDGYIEEFNEEMEEERKNYIEEKVKKELDDMKYDIQEQALKEYLGDDEE